MAQYYRKEPHPHGLRTPFQRRPGMLRRPRGDHPPPERTNHVTNQPTPSRPVALLKRACVLGVLALCACSTRVPETPEPPGTISFEPAAFETLPASEPADWAAALSAFSQSCTRMKNNELWKAPCAELDQNVPFDAEAFFRRNFDLYKVKAGTDDTGLMTGYYEPLLRGSLRRHGPYQTPLLKTPKDLIVVDLAGLHPELKGLRLRGKLEGRRLVPYDERADVVKRPINPEDVIAWVDDPVDAFFLQIQGSGRIELEDGSHIRVGFDDQNGHPYVSLGRHLLETGELSRGNLSMQSIRAWGRKNPGKIDEAMNANPRYVYFKERAGAADEGPLGAQSVPLTPRASVAVDHNVWRYGTPFFVSANQAKPAFSMNRPVIAQDTGSAIRGPIRFDYFWGFGDEAGAAAGRQKSTASAWVMVPKGFEPARLLKQ